MKKKSKFKIIVFFFFTLLLMFFGIGCVLGYLTLKKPDPLDNTSVNFWKSVPKNIYETGEVGKSLDNGLIVFNKNGKDVRIDLGHVSPGELGHYYCDDVTLEIQYKDSLLKIECKPIDINREKTWGNVIPDNRGNYTDVTLKFNANIPLTENDIHSMLTIRPNFKIVYPVKDRYSNTFTDEITNIHKEYEVYVITRDDLLAKNATDVWESRDAILIIGIILIFISLIMLVYFLIKRKRSSALVRVHSK